jgi:hypothetical protein
MKSGVLLSIDKLIIKSIKNDYDLNDISNELKNRCKNIFKIIENDYKSINEFLECDVKDKEAKVKYIQDYIYCCTRRYNDLDWIIKNKNNFKYLTDIKMFNLIKFKDKLKKDENDQYRECNK